MIYQHFERTFRCSDRMCGADDCERCRPGCNGELETERDLTDAGYTFDSGFWEKVVGSSTHTSRKFGAKHGFKPGTHYRKVTLRVVDDETGTSSHSHRFIRLPSPLRTHISF